MKAVLYARVSSERQAEKDLSIKAQIKALREYALKRNWEVVDEFIDEAESARSADRPAFQRIITLAKEKNPPFDVILVWKLNRFARNREDSIIYKSLLRKKGIDVISINEQIDDTASGKLLEGMIELVDEFYSINLSQDTVRGMKENAQRGFLNGGHTPVGYRRKKIQVNGQPKSTLEIVDAEAPIIKKIFTLCLQGEGAKDIATQLNRKNLKRRNGKYWDKSSVSYVLKNEVYAGTLVWKVKASGNGMVRKSIPAEIIKIPNAVPSIISAATFQKAQKAVADRSPKVIPPRSISSDHLLSGLLKCSKCGSSFAACSAKSGKYHYFKCQGSVKGRCPQKALPINKFELFVVRILQERVLTFENLKKLIVLVNDELKKLKEESGSRVKHLEGMILEKTKKRDRLYEAIESENLDLSDVAPRLKQVNEEISELKKQQDQLGLKIREQEFPVADDKTLKPYVEDLYQTLSKGSLFERKSFIRSFIKRIEVSYPYATIEYTIPVNGESKNPREEVLAFDRIGSPTRIRTWNQAVTV